MTESMDKQQADVADEAEKLERRYGDLASVYAKNRAEAASLRGANQDAEHWRDVEDEVEEDKA